ncbi:MMPL family transporter [Dietzia sp. PP-33]|jgi:RND superfamily putative drug exporter|uniref:MMPL family transporter n=1 Tax=Dietzia sp. PP-33 TaxID=2957500 RepID=UPI0029BE8BDA|nr:efflux RND transporter permease subunit [Dietzia sp. PP-33]MDX2356756.1 efflux RND transporter permease subunit [Dietzia sp. PP-33]
MSHRADTRTTQRAHRWRSILTRGWPLAAALVLAVLGALSAGGVEEQLTPGGFRADSTPSAVAERRLDAEVGVGTPDLLVLVSGAESAAVDRDAQAVASYLGDAGGVGRVTVSPAPGDGPTVVSAVLSGDDSESRRTLDTVREALPPPGEGVDRQLTGRAEILREDDLIAREDLVRAELIAVPLTLILLVLFFGSVVAAAVPVAIGVLAMLSTFLVLSGLVHLIDVSVFALNLVIGLALGLSIDYSLLVVARFREELAAGADPPEAVDRTMRRCRRTIVISAVTVGLCLAALTAVDMPFLRSMAMTGVAVVALVATLTLVVLPPVLRVLGRRIDAWSVRRVDPSRPGRSVTAMLGVSRKHPVAVALGVSALLLILLTPAFGLRLGTLDDRVLPPDAPSRVAAEQLRDERPDLGSDPLVVLADGVDPGALAERVSRIDGVMVARGPDDTVSDGLAVGPGDPTLRRGSVSAVEVVTTPGLTQPEQQDLAEWVRDVVTPAPVAGTYSDDVDTRQAITDRAVPVALLVMAVVLPLVFLLTGGVLVTLKTLVMAALSLTVTFGAIVLIFQEGYLADLVGVTATGVVDSSSPLLMACLAFGLSMDYQLFLLSRVREEYDRHGDTTRAVVDGVSRTAPVVGAAAVLVAVVFLAIGTSGISVVRMLGLGMALAVLVDAFVIRLLLVPSAMLLLGEANWWAPRPLRAVFDRLRIRES